jgi:hypothetical protein
MNEEILNLGNDNNAVPTFNESVVQRAVDPISPNANLPIDFSAQYPTPLDTAELIAMCEESNLLRAIPEKLTGLKEETWREMTSLAPVNGSSSLPFADYACPEPYEHNGVTKTVQLKNIGAYKALGVSDIMHSAAVAAAGYGIGVLIGALPASQGAPGGLDMGTYQRQVVADLKAKEMTIASILVLNGLDRFLAIGDATANPLQFNGIEKIVTAANGAHAHTSSSTFSAIDFDRFLGEANVSPTTLFGHPQAIQEVLSGYFQLGYQGAQVVNFSNGTRIIPGYNFAGAVNTGRGQLAVVADANFTRTAGTGTFTSNIYALRMTHNGEPLVYRSTQIPLSFKDLAPGCTSIQFMVWTKTALIVKAISAQSVYTSQFTGNIVTTCPRVGLTNG